MVRTFNNLFDKIRALNNEEEFCKIKASYLEIYNEKTIDLLNHGSKRMNLPLRWNKQNQAFNVENLFVFSCTETQDLVNILLEGTKNRALGSHRFVFHIHKKHIFQVWEVREVKNSWNKWTKIWDLETSFFELNMMVKSGLVFFYFKILLAPSELLQPSAKKICPESLN